MLALVTDRVRGCPRQRVTLRYATTTAATIELSVLAGRNTIRRRPAAPADTAWT